ncbi:MAG: dCMP deaminase family protein [bacterium]|nr:dCMP deaminase family protein [bacterium]
MKRNDYLTWDEYFMGLAMLSAMRSKDPNSQVGACIVDKDNKIVSVGYNGAPIGYDDDKNMTWEREGNFLDTKYAYVCHSELNAILNSRTNVEGCKLYVTLFPCNECAKIIIQSKIKEVIYLSDKYCGTDSNIAAKKMFDVCKIKYKEYKKSSKKVEMGL